jgi:hypothetical protein
MKNEKINKVKNLDYQYKESTKVAGYTLISIIILLILMTLFSSCTGTYYLTQYDDEYNQSMRTDRSSITYYNNQIYWGWNSGYYYYYGTPHYYPWYYYYSVCPPVYYNTTSHVTVNHTVNRPSYRPNVNTVRPNVNVSRPNTTIKVNTNRTNNITVIPNRTNTRVINKKQK